MFAGKAEATFKALFYIRNCTQEDIVYKGTNRPLDTFKIDENKIILKPREVFPILFKFEEHEIDELFSKNYPHEIVFEIKGKDCPLKWHNIKGVDGRLMYGYRTYPECEPFYFLGRWVQIEMDGEDVGLMEGFWGERK